MPDASWPCLGTMTESKDNNCDQALCAHHVIREMYYIRCGKYLKAVSEIRDKNFRNYHVGATRM